MAEPVVLAFEQMMQRQRRRGAVRSGAIGGEPAFDDLARARDRLQFRLEGGRFLAVGMTQSPVARGQREDCLAGRAASPPLP